MKKRKVSKSSKFENVFFVSSLSDLSCSLFSSISLFLPSLLESVSSLSCSVSSLSLLHSLKLSPSNQSHGMNFFNLSMIDSESCHEVYFVGEGNGTEYNHYVSSACSIIGTNGGNQFLRGFFKTNNCRLPFCDA